MMCEHLKDGQCVLASLVIGQPVPVHQSACDTCSALEPGRARQVNYVVISAAAAVIREKHGKNGVEQLVNRFRGAFQPRNGVGSELDKIIHRWLGFWLTDSVACKCGEVKDMMNRYGPNRCRENIEYFVDRLEENHAALECPIPFVRFIAVAAVKTSCRRAEKLKPEHITLPPPLLTIARRPSTANRVVNIT